jgi:UDP-glucose 4-epimerase
MKKILVTGGLGFIGSHLVEELLKNPNYNITVVDDLSTGKLSNIDTTKVTTIIERIQDFIWDKKFDIIYHLGAKANTREKGLKDFEDNVMATEAVVKLLKPNGRIIFSSSCAVYGDQPYVTETSPFQPISPYGYSKWMNELTIRNACKKWTIFRFSNVFGERQDGSNEMGLIGVIEYHLKNGLIMSVFNNGNNYRDYIYVKDVVKALTTVINTGIYQVGSKKSYKTQDLVDISGVWWTDGASNNEVHSIQLDNTKLKRTGWKPTLAVDDYVIKLKVGSS